MENKNTKDLEHLIEYANEANISTIMQSIPAIDIVDYLHNLLNEKHLSKADVIQHSQIQRTYAYQIFQGRKQGSRDKFLQLAFAMQLSVDETNRLLKIANHSTLYVKKKRDAIIQYCIQHRMNLYTLNEFLVSDNLPLLGEFD